MPDLRKNEQKFEALIKLVWTSPVFEEDPDDVYELADLEKPYLLDHANGLAFEMEGTVEIVKFGPVIGG